MKLEKFPVIAPDGTEYYATVELRDAFLAAGRRADVQLYISRKDSVATARRIFYDRECPINQLFKEYEIRNERSSFSSHTPDFVILVRLVLDDYHKELARQAEEAAESEKWRKQLAVGIEAFRQWDGKITNNTEVSK